MWSRIGIIASQPSTWRGLAILLSVLGVQLDPEHINAIVTTGATVVGAIGLIFSDEKKKEMDIKQVLEEGRK